MNYCGFKEQKLKVWIIYWIYLVCSWKFLLDNAMSSTQSVIFIDFHSIGIMFNELNANSSSSAITKMLLVRFIAEIPQASQRLHSNGLYSGCWSHLLRCVALRIYGLFIIDWSWIDADMNAFCRSCLHWLKTTGRIDARALLICVHATDTDCAYYTEKYYWEIVFFIRLLRLAVNSCVCR